MITGEQTTALRELAANTVSVTPKRNYPDLVRFVKTWQSSQSVTVVCQKLGIKHGAAVQLAARMRQKGIALKPFQRRGWNNRLLRELGRYATTVGQPAHFVVGPMARRIADLERKLAGAEQKLRVRA